MIRLMSYEIKKVIAGGRICLLLLLVICFHVLLSVTIENSMNKGIIDRKDVRDGIRNSIVSGELSREELEYETQHLQELLGVYYREQSGQEDALTEAEMEHPGILKDYYNYRECHTEEEFIHTAQAYQDWTEQWEYFDAYELYLKQIQQRAEQAKTVSIWSDPNSYSYQNIQKTAEDFSELDSHLMLGASEGIDRIGQSIWTDWILILFALFLSISIFKVEKENRAYGLIQSCRLGCWKTGLAKIATVFFLETVLYLVLYTENGIIAQMLYGFGPLDRSIQSLESFQNCGMPLDVKQYLIVFFIGKWASLLCFTGIICLFMLLTSGILVPALVSLFFLLVEYFLWINIDIHSPLRLLHYINIFGFTDVYEIIRNYQNLNFFGYPINRATAWLGGVGLLFCILPIVLILLFILFVKNERKKRITWNNLEGRLREFIISWKYRMIPSAVLNARMYWEFRNYFIKSRVLLILALSVLALFIVTTDEANQYGVKKEEASYEEWVKQYEGEITEEKRTAIEEWNIYYETLPEQMDEIDRLYENGEITKSKRDGKILIMEHNQSKYMGFQQFYEQYQSLNEGDGIVSIVDFRHLFSENKTRQAALILVSGMVVVLSVTAVAREFKRNALILVKSTAKGRKWIFLQRSVYCVISVWILTGARFYFQCYVWSEAFQFSAWNVAVQSVPQLGEIGFSGTVFQYLCLIAIFQCIGMTAVSLLVLSVSVSFRQMGKTFLLGAVLFVVPYVLRYVAVNPVVYLGIDRILETEQLFMRGGNLMQRGTYLLILMGVSLFMWERANRTFQKPLTRGKRRK